MTHPSPHSKQNGEPNYKNAKKFIVPRSRVQKKLFHDIQVRSQEAPPTGTMLTKESP